MKKEPALTAAVAQIVALMAARYGFDLGPEASLAVASVLAALLALAVRQLVSPVKRGGSKGTTVLFVAAVALAGCQPSQPCAPAIRAATAVIVSACADAYDRVSSEEDYQRVDAICSAIISSAERIDQDAERLCPQ